MGKDFTCKNCIHWDNLEWVQWSKAFNKTKIKPYGLCRAALPTTDGWPSTYEKDWCAHHVSMPVKEEGDEKGK